MNRIVELKLNIDNPNVDRRAKRDWTKGAVIEAGRYVDNGSSIASLDHRHGWLRGRDREWFLEHVVEDTPRNAKEVLHVLELDHLAVDVLDVLIQQGKITTDDIVGTEDAINAKYEAPSWPCSICKVETTGYGNNAWPINNGRCCDMCNVLVVVPERLEQLREGEAKRAAKLRRVQEERGQ